jgi:hypothetical protein
MQGNISNIDILFRNGLKDLEVLPPPQVWESIAPALRTGRRRKVWFSAAASVAAITALAASALITGSLLSMDFNPTSLTLNQDIRPDGVPGYPHKKVAGIAAQSEPAEAINNRSVGRSISDLAESNMQRLVPSTDLLLVKSVQEDQSVAGFNDQEINGPVIGIGLTESVLPETWALPEELLSVSWAKIDRWSLGAAFSPAVILRQGDTENPVISDMISNEKLMVSYSGGFSISYNLNKRFTLSTGISYSNISQRVTGVNTYTGFAPIIASKGTTDIVITTSAGKIVSANPDIFVADIAASRVSTAYGADVFDPDKSGLPYAGSSLNQNFGYLELPLYVRYKLIDRKLDMNILGGIAYSILVGNSVHTNSFSGEKLFVGKTEGLSPISVSSSMGLGFQYNMSGSLSFTLEPVVRYYISPLGERVGSIIHPWSAGLFTGFSYRF